MVRPLSAFAPSPRLPGEDRGGELRLADRVLYRDGLVLVIDKPAGVAVHPGPGGGPNLESGFAALRFGLPHPPALAHRLDRDTSGCLVLGRHPKALRRLGRLFAEGKVEKIYWAVVNGRPAQDEGRIETGLKKLSRAGGWRIVVDPAGQHAATDYRVLGAANGRTLGRTWLELRPRTGRTHQIRVHCAALGCPVAGDPVYGRADGGSTGAGRAGGRRRCNCSPARSRCRSIRPGRRSRSAPRRRRTCSPPSPASAMIRRARQGWSAAEVSVAGIEVRRLPPADAAFYRDIRLEGLQLNPEAFGSLYEIESAEPLGWFAERLGDSAVFGGFDGPDLLGIVGFFIRRGAKETHKGVLWGMYVRARARKIGLGRRLAEAIVDHARQRVEILQLRVVAGNEPARRLYASLGFVAYGRERNSLKQDGHYWDEVLMAKPLMAGRGTPP